MERLEINGISVHYKDTGHPGKPVVVMSNSLAADLSMWELQAARLSRSYRVIRYDMRGHGGTEAIDGDYSLDLLAQDVLGLAGALGIDRFHFIGLSLGGMIGQVLGATSPERLESLVLCATFASAPRDLWDDRARTVRRDGVEAIAESTLERWLTADFRAAHPAVADHVRAMIRGTSATGYAGCAAAIRDMDLAGVPERISAPTLMIAATDDTSATPEAMKTLQQRIPGAELTVIENAAHMFTFEKADQTSRILAGFLGGVRERGGEGSGGLATSSRQ